MVITVLVVDDHQLFRQGVVRMLGGVDEIEVLAEARNGLEAIDKVGKFKPNVVLMDVAMPELGGLEATKVLSERYPETKVIALTMHSDQQYIKAMLESGAKGFLFKNCTYSQLIEAISAVHNGKRYLDGLATEVVLDSYLGSNTLSDDESGDSVLSKRELEILRRFAEGQSTKEISDELFISVKTVGTHRQNILMKLNLNSLADLVKYAIKKGIIKL